MSPYSRISVTLERQVVRPAPDRDHEPGLHVLDGVPVVREIRLTDEAQQVLEVVEHLHGRRRVVDRRRQRADRDVDHDPDRECRILLDRPLDAERDHRAQPVLRFGAGIAPVDLDQRRARRDEVADRMTKDDEARSRAPTFRARGSRSPGSRRRASSGRRGPARPAGCTGAGTTAGASGLAASSSTSRSASSGLGDERGDRDRPQPMDARSRKMTKRRIPSPRNDPASVTPRFGTSSSSTCRMSVYENVNVPMSTRARP